LLGPFELLERLQAAGGLIPSHGASSGATSKAAEYTSTLAHAVLDTAREVADANPLQLPDDPTYRAAWVLSVTNSMNQSVPWQNRCRHIRAADPQVTELRTFVSLTAGIWQCIECFKEGGAAKLKANPWPNQCDLCGAHSEEFNEIAGNMVSCFVTLSACPRCASFVGS